MWFTKDSSYLEMGILCTTLITIVIKIIHIKKIESENQKHTTKIENQNKKNRGSLRQLSAALKTKLNTIDTDPKNEKCVICNSVKHKRTVEKFPISDKDRADKFLKAACCLLDDVYIRICDFQDIGSLFGSQLYCHKACINHYLINYDRISKRT